MAGVLSGWVGEGTWQVFVNLFWGEKIFPCQHETRLATNSRLWAHIVVLYEASPVSKGIRQIRLVCLLKEL